MRVGGLICYEHHMTLLRAAMAIRGEELHVAVWPGWWSMDGHLGAKRAEPGSRGCDIEPAVKAHAIENSVFVVSSSWYLPPGEIPAELRDVMKYNLAVGGSCIVNPSGLFTQEPVFEKRRSSGRRSTRPSGGSPRRTSTRSATTPAGT